MITIMTMERIKIMGTGMEKEINTVTKILKVNKLKKGRVDFIKSALFCA
jgi:hypothetical protein